MTDDLAKQRTAAPAGLLTMGRWVYRTPGEGLRVAGPAGKDPTAIVQILATDSRRTPEQIKALTEAYRRLASWSNEGSVLPIDFGILTNTGVYLTFPLTSGRLLRQLVGGQDHVFTLEQSLSLLRPLADCLDRGHAAGFLHLALSPTQIVVGKTLSNCRLLDFGLRSLVLSQDAGRDPALDRDRWAFWAPEIWHRRAATPATDQFALASLAYLLLTGQFLVDASTANVARNQCEAAVLTGVAKLESMLQPIFTRALAARSEDRYPTCKEFVAALAPPVDPVADDAQEVDSTADRYDLDADYDVLADFSEPESAPAMPARTMSGELPAPDTVAGSAPAQASAVGAHPGGGSSAPRAANVTRPAVTAAGLQAELRPSVAPLSVQPARSRARRAVPSVAQVLALLLLSSLPISAYAWTRLNRPHLEVHEVERPAEAVVPIPDAEIVARTAYTASLLEQLRTAKLPDLAPEQWRESEALTRQVQNLSQAQRVNDFITAADRADEKLEANVRFSRALSKFQKEFDDLSGAMRAGPESPLQLLKQYDKSGWQDAEKMLADAGSLRKAGKLAEAHAKLDDVGQHIVDRQWIALRQAAINGESAAEQLASAAALIAAGRAEDEVRTHFDEVARATPGFWLDQGEKLLANLHAAEGAFAWGERAAALRDMQRDDWADAFSRARAAAREISDGDARCEAFERLLEVACESGDRGAVDQVLDDVCSAAAGPPDLTRRLLGFALVTGHVKSWQKLGEAAFLTPAVRVGDAIETFTIAARYGNNFQVARMLASQGATLLSRCELALAAAERGDREQFTALLKAINDDNPALAEDDAQIVESHRLAGAALLGDFDGALAKLADLPPAHRDFVGTYVAIAAARGDKPDVAQQALAQVSPTYLYRVRAVRDLARQKAHASDVTPAQLYEWMIALPSITDRAVASTNLSAFGQAKEPATRATSATAAPSSPPANGHFKGPVISRNDGEKTKAKGDSKQLDLYVLAPKSPAAQGEAYIGGEKPGEFVPATVSFSPGFATIKELLATAPAETRRTPQTPKLSSYVVTRGSPSSLGLRFSGPPDEPRNQTATGIVVLGAGEAVSNDDVQRLERDRLAGFYEWLVLPNTNRRTMLWPPYDGKQQKQTGTPRRVIKVQVQGTSQTQVDMVNAAALVLNQSLPKAWHLDVDQKVYTTAPKLDDVIHGKSDGRLFVHFAPIATHRAIAEGSYHTTDWPGETHFGKPVRHYSNSVTVGVAMIDPELLGSDEERQHATSLEMTRALGIGMRGYFPLAGDSIFAGPQAADGKIRTKLTDLDRTFVGFIYSFCAPNQDRETAIGHFGTNWVSFNRALAERGKKPEKPEKNE